MKSLLFICLLLVLYGTAVSLVRDYIYGSQTMSWTAAQSYCQQHYGNLAIITSEEEHQKALMVTGQSSFVAWIGLNRTEPHVNSWKWIDGEEVKFTKWNPGEPNDKGSGEDCAVTFQTGWCDTGCGGSFSSMCCRSFTLVNEKKTWDEALKHCRTNYTDLTFVDSQSLLDLLKIETEPAQTASVWIGLRFLDGKWFWLNWMPLGSLVSLPSCPAQPYRCGAYNFNRNVWENRDCNEELNFLCYF